MTYKALMDSLTDDERARLFAYNTPEQLADSLAERGLDVDCNDDDTLAGLARVHVGYQLQRETICIQRETTAGQPANP